MNVMKRAIIFLSSLILVLALISPTLAYRWPFSNSDGPNRITATLGEYRSTHHDVGGDGVTVVELK